MAERKGRESLIADIPVEKGMTLLLREKATDAMPERFRLWTVAGVRKTAKGASIRLLSWSPGVQMEATATLDGGLVKEPWQVFRLSQGDLRHVYEKHADA